MIFLSLILTAIFLILAAIHFNWALGSEWGFDAVLPINEKGEKLFKPRKIDSAIVGIGLTLFALFYFFQTNLVAVEIPTWVYKYGGWIIPSIFLIRAIGDFKYAGFFKKIKHTKFGRMDTKFFSPLCFVIGVIGFVIQLI